jgi:hypothetical protein
VLIAGADHVNAQCPMLNDQCPTRSAQVLWALSMVPCALCLGPVLSPDGRCHVTDDGRLVAGHVSRVSVAQHS